MSPLKTLWVKEKMLVTSIFSFSNNVFYPIKDKIHHYFEPTFIFSQQICSILTSFFFPIAQGYNIAYLYDSMVSIPKFMTEKPRIFKCLLMCNTPCQYWFNQLTDIDPYKFVQLSQCDRKANPPQVWSQGAQTLYQCFTNF